ncbi:class I SAM-dependent methyltransferase [Sorangium sp. So ce426]|uniref:class I SAM-dependent methyltransferase n=1 Tax=Sorangium sp. So ce426 TaxID=3133312 RepID=UPI003F5BC67C
MSLVRVLEPEVMDTDEDARAYDSMDHAAVNTAFCDALLSHNPGLAYALDVGTGTCLLPIELCRRAPAARIKAIDLSAAMLDLGRRHVEQAGLTEAIALALVDAKALPEPDETFSAVLSNSIVHHVPEPAQVLREMLRVLQPGGLLFVRDLVRPEDEASVAALVDTYAANDTAYQRALFDASLRAALSLDEVREVLRSLRIPPECAQVTSDRHWTLAFRRAS